MRPFNFLCYFRANINVFWHYSSWHSIIKAEYYQAAEAAAGEHVLCGAQGPKGPAAQHVTA